MGESCFQLRLFPSSAICVLSWLDGMLMSHTAHDSSVQLAVSFDVTVLHVQRLQSNILDPDTICCADECSGKPANNML